MKGANKKKNMKTELVCTRVTSQIKEAIVREAVHEGLVPSEWLRNLIIKELKERNALPKKVFPKVLGEIE